MAKSAKRPTDGKAKKTRVKIRPTRSYAPGHVPGLSNQGHPDFHPSKASRNGR